ncbi:MAG: uracil-DNA glycosylase [Candidatus Hydrogenedentes bacterium]|nr:uracil-DNA glycosylase [Candidatus Hydrogenedentota bacterium]
MTDPYSELIPLATELVRRAAHPRKGTIALSPEVKALLESIGQPEPVEDDLWVSEEQSVETRPQVGLIPGSTPVIDPSTITTLEELAAVVSQCTKCGLCAGRKQAVFSDGNPNAELVFVGEAPGAEEDRRGIPFVGAAGQLLTDIIVKGMKIRREDVYICNVIKCRPPDNRDPLPDEKEKCEPYLIRQLELLRPKAICALGRHAAQTLLKTEDSTGKLRGKWHLYHGIPLRVTYHPAYLLRNPADKRKTWDDIQEVMKLLKGEVEPPRPTAPASRPEPVEDRAPQETGELW